MTLVPANIDQAKVLATLGINVNDPKSQAALLVCERYGLDPLLKHVVLIQGAVYLTRDGFLHIAHQSGVFDGMEVVDEGETETYYWAKVSVWRKDMSRAFTCRARCRKDEKTFADKWDQATTRAERRALKRAFDVAGLPAEGEYEEFDELYDKETGEALAAPATAPLERSKRQPVTVAEVLAIHPDTADQLGVDMSGQPVDAPSAQELAEQKQQFQEQRFDEPPLPDEPFEDRMTQPQRKKLFALLNEAGMADRAQRLEWAHGQLGRTISSYNDLTVDEGRALIDLAEKLPTP